MVVCVCLCVWQIQGCIHPHAIIILPNSAGTEVLACYEDEGVYIDTYGRIIKDTVLQWGEMPASVGEVFIPPTPRAPQVSLYIICLCLLGCEFAGVYRVKRCSILTFKLISLDKRRMEKCQIRKILHLSKTDDANGRADCRIFQFLTLGLLISPNIFLFTRCWVCLALKKCCKKAAVKTKKKTKTYIQD